jgi:hypothetical protein
LLMSWNAVVLPENAPRTTKSANAMTDSKLPLCR